MRRGCYPGSFDPLTVAHIAIAAAAVEQCRLDVLVMMLSRSALGKDRHHHRLEERVEAINLASADRPWLQVEVTEHRLIADIAAGFDVVVVGADKWEQLFDVAFYDGSIAARDEAIGRLPEIVCAPRSGHLVPHGVHLLDVPDWVARVSSTAVRSGADQWRWRPSRGGTRQGPE